jgi:hypothetical protein
MAIANTSTLVPISYDNHVSDRERSYTNGNKKIYVRDCDKRKEDPATIVKWMRRNFGERHQGWDFQFISGCVTIEIWDDRLKTMYEMWHG